MNFEKTISTRLRLAMANKGCTVLQLAKTSGISASTIYDIRGEDSERHITVHTIKKLANALDVPAEWLSCFTD
jgi:transcriptional regulator with XRE-family HTH domain|nr:MAG TPA: helix-turn-helix domain protein [Caudoviricetes sp.]